jgi:hypothetical protein
MSDASDARVTLDYTPCGENGTARIVARIGDRTIYTDKLEPARASARSRFVQAVIAVCPFVKGEELSIELMGIADALAMDDPEAKAKPTPTEMASYADAHLIVELGWNCETAKPDFIIWDRYLSPNTHQVSRAERVETAIGVIVVPSIAGGLATPGTPVPGAVLIPTAFDPEGENETRLRADVEAFIERYVELPADALSVAVEYVLLTWIHDAFDELPYVAFRTADAGRGKSRALETVGALCYRPMFVGGGSSSAATLRMLDIFGGTLLADEFDQKHNTELAADLIRILNQGFQRNRPLIKCDGESNEPRAFRCFGPKLFALRKSLGDDASESRTISIRMTRRTRANIPINLPRERFDREALVLRNRLLAWRFAAYGNVRLKPELADPSLEDRGNQIGVCLLSLARTDESRARIVAALRDQQDSVTMARSESLAGEVFNVILATAQPGGIVRPADLALEVNRRHAAAESVELDRLKDKLTREKTAWLLRQVFELPRQGRDAAGTRYYLEPVRMGELGERFGGCPVGLTRLTRLTLAPEPTPENSLFDHENAGSVSRVSRVSRTEHASGTDQPALEPTLDEAERRAIQEVEAKEEHKP